MNKNFKITTSKSFEHIPRFLGFGKGSTIISLIFHLVFVILIITGLPFVTKKLIDSPHIVVELMPINKVTNLASKNTPETKKPELEKPKASTTPAPEPIIKKEEPIKPKEEIKTPPPEKPKPKIIKEKKPEEKKKEKEKEKPKDKKILDKKKFDNYESLLKTLEESSDKKNDNKNKSKNYSKINDYDPNKSLSITTENDIKRQLYACWSPPSGAKNAKDMAVLIRIKFASDGTVTEATHIDNNIFAGDQFYKAAVSAALRAVWKCSPLQIPKAEYNNWKEIEFNFDPSTMIY